MLDCENKKSVSTLNSLYENSVLSVMGYGYHPLFANFVILPYGKSLNVHCQHTSRYKKIMCAVQYLTTITI